MLKNGAETNCEPALRIPCGVQWCRELGRFGLNSRTWKQDHVHSYIDYSNSTAWIRSVPVTACVVRVSSNSAMATFCQRTNHNVTTRFVFVVHGATTSSGFSGSGCFQASTCFPSRVNVATSMGSTLRNVADTDFTVHRSSLLRRCLTSIQAHCLAVATDTSGCQLRLTPSLLSCGWRSPLARAPRRCQSFYQWSSKCDGYTRTHRLDGDGEHQRRGRRLAMIRKNRSSGLIWLLSRSSSHHPRRPRRRRPSSKIRSNVLRLSRVLMSSAFLVVHRTLVNSNLFCPWFRKNRINKDPFEC